MIAITTVAPQAIDNLMYILMHIDIMCRRHHRHHVFSLPFHFSSCCCVFMHALCHHCNSIHKTFLISFFYIAQLIGHPSPGPMQFTSVMPYSVSVSWAFPEGLTDSPKFRIVWCQCSGKSEINTCLLNSPRRRPSFLIPRRFIPETPAMREDCKYTPSHMIVQCSHATIDGLRPGTNYDFCVSSITETGIESRYVPASVKTGMVSFTFYKSENHHAFFHSFHIIQY